MPPWYVKHAEQSLFLLIVVGDDYLLFHKAAYITIEEPYRILTFLSP
ncbi:hypothetical protein HMPREF3232_01375 [Fannyhessea vaginae]|nr:hypothetical protein HMPREF3232_01375 [Fannyhessea vaginae]